MASLKVNAKPFNLVEIVISLAVIALGATAVMAILQPSVVASRDSIGDNYSADMASQFLSYYEVQARQNWATLIGTATALSNSPPTQPASIANDSIEDPGNWATPVGAGNIYTTGGSLSVSNGLYGVKIANDFSGEIRLWKRKINDLRVAGANTELPANKGIKLCIEISYPATKPYSVRDRKYFSLEVFN